MFARFGREAREVIELAEDHARALWRPAVGPEHLLLALLAVDDRGMFARVGLRFDEVRARLLESPGGDVRSSAAALGARHLPLRLRSVFGDAFRHAALLGSPEVTPLHLALALMEHPPGEISRVLRAADVDAQAVRDVLRAEIVEAAIEGQEQTGDGTEEANVLRLPPAGDRQPAAQTRPSISAAT